MDETIRSRQEHHCKKHKSPAGEVWLALDPEQMEASQQAHAEGREAFAEWKASKQVKTNGQRDMS